tara:strand:+ start:1564 stop:1779 length:216 start_codon:yes stop_codon:yes gene_type:complete
MTDLILDRNQIIDALKKANSIQGVFYTNGIANDDDLQHLSTVDLLTDLIYALNDNLYKIDNDKGLNITKVR